jgi:hypothetical protein
VRKQRVVLEHHADLPPLGRQMDAGLGVGQRLPGNQHSAPVAALETGHGAQHRSLAAARRPDQHADLPGAQAQADALHGVARAGAARIAHGNRFQAQEHGCIIICE